MNIRVGSENGKAMGRVRIRKFWQFSINKYWNNIGCLILTHNFGVGGLDYGRRRREKR